MDRSKMPVDGDCPERPEEEKTTHEIALERCDELIKRYGDLKTRSHLRSDVAQGIALVLNALVSVVLLFPILRSDWADFAGAAFSAGAAIFTGFVTIGGWRESYIRRGYIWHALQAEKYRYRAHARDDYAGEDQEEAARKFASRIEDMVMTEVTDWRADMKRIDQDRIGLASGSTNT